MFAQGKVPHHVERHPLTHPEEAAQEHHYRDGAQYADAKLITLRGVAITKRLHQPRQPNGDQKARDATQHKAPGLAGDHFRVTRRHGVD